MRCFLSLDRSSRLPVCAAVVLGLLCGCTGDGARPGDGAGDPSGAGAAEGASASPDDAASGEAAAPGDGEAAAPGAEEATGVDAGDAAGEEDEPAPAVAEDSTEESPVDIPEAGPHPGLLDPSLADETAPDVYRAEFSTTKGDFTIEVHRDWSPRGADRFYNLVEIGFYDGVKFFRVVRDPRPFAVQFGISGDPAVSAKWSQETIRDDPVKESNVRGMVTFAKTRAPNSRSTQVFINLGDNSGLDDRGFAPFGEVVEGMDVVDSLEGKYGEAPTRLQGQMIAQGNAFLEARFPDLDAVKEAEIVSTGGAEGSGAGGE